MSKYHISPKTGNPNRCYANTKPCPIGGEGEHYSSKEEAREAFEKEMGKGSSNKSIKKVKGENPKYGVPTGVTTLEKFKGKYATGYSSLPNKDVPVLENSERFCTRCGEPVQYEKGSYSGTWKHSGGDSYCKSKDAEGNRVFISVNSVCNYCGTGDPSHSTFKHQPYSDETSCSRCGGVSGYGIGD